MRQTCDKSSGDWVRHNDKYNGNCACEPFQRNGTHGRYCDDDIDVAVDKFLPKGGIAIDLLGRKFVQELDVLALDVSEIGEGLNKHGEILALLLSAARVPEHTDSRDLPA